MPLLEFLREGIVNRGKPYLVFTRESLGDLDSDFGQHFTYYLQTAEALGQLHIYWTGVIPQDHAHEFDASFGRQDVFAKRKFTDVVVRVSHSFSFPERWLWVSA